MKNTTNSASLSSTFVRSRNSAATVTAQPAQDFGWRSEAFAEDLQADATFSHSQRQASSRWKGVLQCLLPLAVAAVGGIVAYLNTLA